MNCRFVMILAGLLSSAPAVALPPSKQGPTTVESLTVAGPGSTGEISKMCTKAPGSSVCRAFDARADDNVNVLDYGADRSGSSNSLPSVVYAGEQAAARKLGVFVPPGTYRFGTQYVPPNDTPFFAMGAAFPSGNFATIGDITQTPAYTFFKVSTTGSTDNTVNIGLITRGSPAASNYQNSALFVRAVTEDSGSCLGTPPTGCKDIVGITATGNVAPNVHDGRAYGANFTAKLSPGATGVAAGYEVDVYNETGTDKTQDYYKGVGGGGNNSIVGSTVVCGGNAPCDAAYSVSSLNPSQAKFATGIRMLRGAVRDYVLEVNDDTTGNLRNLTAFIRADGTAGFKGLTVDFSSTFGGGFFSVDGTFVGENALTVTGGKGSATAVASVKAASGPVSISGPAGKGALTGLFSSANDPTTSDIPTGYCADWVNTSTTVFKHWCNYGGALRGIVMN